MSPKAVAVKHLLLAQQNRPVLKAHLTESNKITKGIANDVPSSAL